MSMVRPGYLSLIQYVSAIILIFLISWHLILRFPPLHGVESFIDTMKPEILYEEITVYGVLLVLLLVAAVFHGVNGIRSMLLEWSSNKYWTLIVNLLAIIVFLVLIVVGIHTVLYVTPP